MNDLQQYSLLLYSNYSPNCKKLMEIVQKNIPLEFGLNNICIDNEKVRHQIKKNQKIKISGVPCILVIFPDGIIEKYDGSHAFRWIEEIALKLRPEIKVPQNHTEMIQTQTNQKSFSPKQNNLEDEDIEIKYKNKKPIRRKENIEERKVTSIDSIESENEDKVEIEQFDFKKPVKIIRTDAGNYDVQIDDEILNESPKRDVKRGIKQNGNQLSQKGQSDLITQAQKMQKLREMEDDEMHPHKMISE